eukprot:Platyproteum_vivax@DN6002_c0_g1_i1.p1
MKSVSVKKQDGSYINIRLDLDNEALRVLDLQEAITEAGEIPVSSQRLVFHGRVLIPEKTLKEYNIVENSVVYLLQNVPPEVDTSSRPPAPPTPRIGATSSIRFGAGQPPDFQRVQRHLVQNPDILQQVMNSPMMQNLLGSPETLQMLLQSNPQMRELMESNPELSHMLNDPQMLQQSMQMFRNPNLLREVMRTSDRALSNIEATPGGFNTLLRMYQNIQEPIWNATINGGLSTADNSRSQQYQHNTTINNEEMPNPWRASPLPVGGGGGPLRGEPPMDNMMRLMQDSAIQQMVTQMLNNSQTHPPGGTNPFNSLGMGTPSTPPPSRNSVGTPRNPLNPLVNPVNPAAPLVQMPPPFSNQTGANSADGLNLTPANPFFNPNSNNLSGGPQVDESQMRQAFEQMLLASNPPNNQEASLEERYQYQLQQLQSMGFSDNEASLAALSACNGNLNRAIDWLLAHPPP